MPRNVRWSFMMSSILSFEKIYMAIPYEDKDWAKNNGFKFDGWARTWYLPPGKDPLPFWDYWSYLENTFHDREELRSLGCKFNRKLKKWYVPLNNKVSYDQFTKWWPESFKQFIFNDRFVVEKHISRTGQAEMFQARDPHDGKRYAIKYFSNDLSNVSTASYRNAVGREIDALQRLESHPNILKIVDWGENKEAERLFIVSPWKPYGNLDKYIGKTNEERLFDLLYSIWEDGDLFEVDFDEALEELKNERSDIWLDSEEIIIGILRGIIYAHTHNILHRDIKPGNVLLDIGDLEDEDPGFIPIICDFGTAKIFEGSEIRRSEHTMVGFRTRPYRPEFSDTSKEGAKELQNQMTWDLFAWAVLTIEIVANKFVENVEEALEVLQNEIAPNIDKEIVDLLMSATAKDPSDRPQKIEKFRDQIVKLTEARKKRLGWEK